MSRKPYSITNVIRAVYCKCLEERPHLLQIFEFGELLSFRAGRLQVVCCWRREKSEEAKQRRVPITQTKCFRYTTPPWSNRREDQSLVLLPSSVNFKCENGENLIWKWFLIDFIGTLVETVVGWWKHCCLTWAMIGCLAPCGSGRDYCHSLVVCFVLFVAVSQPGNVSLWTEVRNKMKCVSSHLQITSGRSQPESLPAGRSSADVENSRAHSAVIELQAAQERSEWRWHILQSWWHSTIDVEKIDVFAEYNIQCRGRDEAPMKLLSCAFKNKWILFFLGSHKNSQPRNLRTYCAGSGRGALGNRPSLAFAVRRQGVYNEICKLVVLCKTRERDFLVKKCQETLVRKRESIWVSKSLQLWGLVSRYFY